MSRGFYQNIKRADTKDLPADPRFPIARHIEWSRSFTNETEYSVPEPDTYNRAVMAERPIECKFLEDHVFYRDLVRNKWWTIYYVPPDKIDAYEQWIVQQECDLLWWHSKPAQPRRRKSMLYNRKNSPEMTAEERLYTMGYFAKLHSKYFSEDDTMLLERLGPIRTEVLEQYLNL